MVGHLNIKQAGSRLDPEEKGLRRFAMGTNKRLNEINNRECTSHSNSNWEICT